MTALCTLSDIRAIRGNDDYNIGVANIDEIIKIYAQATSKYFEKRCLRKLMKVQFSEYFDGNNSYEKYLKEPNETVPIVAGEPFVLYKVSESSPFTETLIPATDYRIFDDGLLTYKAGFICGKRNYRAIYYVGFDCTGWDTMDIGGSEEFGVPEDLRKACAMQTVINLKKMSGKYGDSRLGLTAKGLIETEQMDKYVTGIEDEVDEILKKYIKIAY